VSPKKKSSASRRAASEEITTTAPEDGSKQASSPSVAPGNVDQIRDILFGAQMRDYERRFVRLEEKVSKDVAKLREEMGKRSDDLEAFIQREVESLGDRLASEQKDRVSRDDQLKTEIDALMSALESKAADLDEKLTSSTRDLRKQILDQSKSLSKEIDSRSAALTQSLEKEAGQLQVAKLDRSKLAEILSQISIQLTDELALSLGLEAESAGDD
jgi:hypothetical protein